MSVSREDGTSQIHLWLKKQSELSLEFFVDGDTVGSISYVAKEHRLVQKPAISFDIKEGVKSIKMVGTLVKNGECFTINQRFEPIDVRQITKVLYEQNVSIVEKYKNVVELIESLTDEDDPSTSISFEHSNHDFTAAWQEQEEKFGVIFPDALKELLDYEITIDEYSNESHHFRTPSNLGDFSEENRFDGWTDDEEIIAFYKDAIPIVIEVGDGYGMFAWAPKGLGGEFTDTGVWFYTHQEGFEPEMLLNPDGSAMTADKALIYPLIINVIESLIEDLAERDYADILTFPKWGSVPLPPHLFVDSAHPNCRYQLSFDETDDGVSVPRLSIISYNKYKFANKY